jgi:Na+/H+ antiporter NhaA
LIAPPWPVTVGRKSSQLHAEQEECRTFHYSPVARPEFGNAGCRPTDTLRRIKYDHLHLIEYLILPGFTLANTNIAIDLSWEQLLGNLIAIGILAGLLVGKPLGIMLFSVAAVTMGACRLQVDLTWKHIFGAGLLGGIGFTMSIFIASLAFAADASLINTSKLAIMLASLLAGSLGCIWLKMLSKSETEPSMPKRQTRSTRRTMATLRLL